MDHELKQSYLNATMFLRKAIMLIHKQKRQFSKLNKARDILRKMQYEIKNWRNRNV